MKEKPIQHIIANYYLGIAQGKEIVEWAQDCLFSDTPIDEDFINKLAFVDKNNPWELAEAEEVFIEHFNPDNKEIIFLIKNYLLEMLTDIVERKCKLYNLADTISRIDDKFNHPEWINELASFCLYLQPNSQITDNIYMEKEIIKTINDLTSDLKERST